jgi:uncharacterized membrane protein YedE/YeeE
MPNLDHPYAKITISLVIPITTIVGLIFGFGMTYEKINEMKTQVSALNTLMTDHLKFHAEKTSVSFK